MDRDRAFEFLSQRTRVVTRIFNDIPLGLAGVCLATDTPRLLAAASLLAVLSLGIFSLKPYDRVFRLLREVNHPVTQIRVVWRRMLSASFGWWVLSLVALGFVGKHGFELMGWTHF